MAFAPKVADYVADSLTFVGWDDGPLLSKHWRYVWDRIKPENLWTHSQERNVIDRLYYEEEIELFAEVSDVLSDYDSLLSERPTENEMWTMIEKAAEQREETVLDFVHNDSYLEQMLTVLILNEMHLQGVEDTLSWEAYEVPWSLTRLNAHPGECFYFRYEEASEAKRLDMARHIHSVLYLRWKIYSVKKILYENMYPAKTRLHSNSEPDVGCPTYWRILSLYVRK